MIYRASCLTLAMGALLLSGCGDDGEPGKTDLFSFVDQGGGGCTSCSGCCDTATNSCQSGTSSSACGFGGLSCKICQGTEQCLSGTCIATTPQCSASTCPGGCCGPNGCVNPPNTAFCGVGGASCQACTSGNICKSGACASAGPVTYGVVIKSAQVSGEACNRAEVGDSECDTFVEITFGGQSYGPTATIENNNSPSWNEEVFSATDADLIAKGINFVVYDHDSLTPNDELGTCTLKPTAADLKSGELVKNCGADVTNFTLGFVKKN